MLCLFTLVGVAFGVAKLRMSRFGSAMLAVRANERSAAGVGVNVVRVKVLSFALASFIAGLGGCLLAYRRGVVTFDSFTALGGLALFSTAYLAGITSVFGGITAGILAASGIVFIAIDRWVHLGDWFPVITGVALILTLIFHPEGVASIGHRVADRLARCAPSADGPAAEPSPRSVPPAADADRADGRVDAPAGRSRWTYADRPLRRRDRGLGRVAPRGAGRDRRPHRSQRRRQDQRDRRHHRLRGGAGRRPARRRRRSTGLPRTPGCGPAWRGRSSRSSCTTTSRSRRT